jgi:hypothetical protein
MAEGEYRARFDSEDQGLPTPADEVANGECEGLAVLGGEGIRDTLEDRLIGLKDRNPLDDHIEPLMQVVAAGRQDALQIAQFMLGSGSYATAARRFGPLSGTGWLAMSRLAMRYQVSKSPLPLTVTVPRYSQMNSSFRSS